MISHSFSLRLSVKSMITSDEQLSIISIGKPATSGLMSVVLDRTISGGATNLGSNVSETSMICSMVTALPHRSIAVKVLFTLKLKCSHVFGSGSCVDTSEIIAASVPLQSSLTLTLLADGILSQFTRTVSSNVSKNTGATVSIKINMALASLIFPQSSIATNVTSTLNSQTSGSTVSSFPKSPCCSSAPFIENLKESKSTLKSQLSSIDAPPNDCIH